MRAFILTALAAALSANPAFAQLESSNAPRPSQQATGRASDGIEVLTRGPVHEAFAETITFDPREGMIAPKAPPEPIEELPPEEKPEGENVAWIAGYWAWDDERDDYLWVSGIWRALPPGRQWVPGYWSQSRDGAQWISGYWADAEISETEYLPEPPATLEVGPSIAAPSVDHRWLPGCWLWHQNRYAWRPGYWSIGYSNWTWIPAHYVWTPRGYVFVDGYYDFDVNQRGIVYAPVYLRSRLYSQRRYAYTPSVVINPAVLISHLFLRPSFGHYYFGDYYGGNYIDRGYSPWFAYNANRLGYDPFFAHQSWVNRQNQQQWQRNLEANFQNYRDNESARPPRTWEDQLARIARANVRERQDLLIAASIPELAEIQKSPIKFQKLEENERQQIAKHDQAINQFRNERQKVESKVIAARPDPTSNEPRNVPSAKVKLPKSPIAAQPIAKVAKEKAPPKREEAPPPDMKVEPKPRSPREPGKPPASNPKLPRDPDATIPKAGAPRTDPRNPPRNEPRNEEPPKSAAPKPRDPAPVPKQPAPKSPAPKQPTSKQPAPKQPTPKQPAPKQDPPKAQAPKPGPRENSNPPQKDKPKGEEKKPKTL
jgi:hypothetical protein